MDFYHRATFFEDRWLLIFEPERISSFSKKDICRHACWPAVPLKLSGYIAVAILANSYIAKTLTVSRSNLIQTFVHKILFKGKNHYSPSKV